MILADNAAPYVEYVFEHLWARGVEELAGLGLAPDEAASWALDFCRKGPSRALLDEDEKPVCVFGIVDGMTWFQATDDFLKHHAEITRVIRDMAKGYDCVIYSQCVHPRTEAWFGKLGFVRDEWEGKTPTGKPVYRFKRA